VAPREELSSLIPKSFRSWGREFFIMKNNNLSKIKYNVVIFDCDSTLTKIEGIDELARFKRKKSEVAVLTKKAMEGKIDFEDILERRLNLVRPSKKDLERLGSLYIKNEVKNAKKVIRALKKLGVKVYIVTGGYKMAIEIFARYLGIKKENVFAIDLEFNEKGDYLGYNHKNLLIKNDGKRKMIRKLAQGKRAIFVGDGATDLAAKNEVNLFVGFGGVAKRQIVRKQSDIFIEEKSLLPILNLVLDHQINN